jgi:hypothetical protein
MTPAPPRTGPFYLHSEIAQTQAVAGNRFIAVSTVPAFQVSRVAHHQVGAAGGRQVQPPAGLPA